MMPLVTICVPTRDAHRAAEHAADDGFEFFRPRGAVAIQSHQRVLGKQFAQRFLDALVPWPTGLTAKPQRRQRSGSASIAPQ